MFMTQYLHHLNKFARTGVKFRLGKHSFIVIKGSHLYYVYKRYEKSLVYIENIKC
jgi:hypothetical protein